MEYLQLDQGMEDEYVTLDMRLGDAIVLLKTLELLIQMGEIDLMETYESLFTDIAPYGKIVESENTSNLQDNSAPSI